jgi:hypothetical protein
METVDQLQRPLRPYMNSMGLLQQSFSGLSEFSLLPAELELNTNTRQAIPAYMLQHFNLWYLRSL